MRKSMARMRPKEKENTVKKNKKIQSLKRKKPIKESINSKRSLQLQKKNKKKSYQRKRAK